MRNIKLLAAAMAIAVPCAASAQPAPSVATEAAVARVDAIFSELVREKRVPGMTYGIVKDGRLLHVRAIGLRDAERGLPATVDTRFRIASMSKAFTAMAILKLRDAGKLSLDAPAEAYVPHLRGWRYPTSDSPRITVRDLLHHSAGFVEDNPWGDRQQPLSEDSFSAMLGAGVPFANAPGLRMEYSNYGYALLGRIVGTVSGVRYQDYIGQQLLAPLQMRSTGYDIFTAPGADRARGFRWQDERWVREPDMADGAFGAMGGMETTANDYWRWVAFLMNAWPARDGADAGPVSRATAREIVRGSNFTTTRARPVGLGAPCRQAVSYAMGWSVVDDCDLGRVVTHGGGYPGFGSVVAMLPDAGVGVFAFTNRTYTGASQQAWRALLALRETGLAPDRAIPVGSGLAAAYAVAKAAWTAGDPQRAPLADNVLLDRDVTRRRADIATLKASVGDCAMAEPIAPTSAMEGSFSWTCTKGRVAGRVQRAPTPTLSLQVLDFTPAP
ncbi:MAG: penicillin-binding protein [Sphingomonas bacterium]|uniref:serine hydrolase domain-containing protein n=1 Tax=Sphingomonas bacterium TaxID=1895847 RepID=UPI00261C5F8E|nr:serine hydrolase domain-containing protein [Sphingomonas bacterium]MDB5696922.1 penicillin-binding protein [Sphingomonas bacterium]